MPSKDGAAQLSSSKPSLFGGHRLPLYSISPPGLISSPEAFPQTCTGEIFLGTAGGRQGPRRAWTQLQESGAQQCRKELEGGYQEHSLPAATKAPSSITGFPETATQGEDFRSPA